MKITESGRARCKSNDFRKCVLEIAHHEAISPSDLYGTLSLYTAMNLCLKPDGTVSIPDDGSKELTRFINDNQATIDGILRPFVT